MLNGDNPFRTTFRMLGEAAATALTMTTTPELNHQKMKDDLDQSLIH